MISASRIRLTKDLVAAMALAVAALVLGVPNAQATCGQADGKSGGKSADHEHRATIALQNLDSRGPVYYWHDSSTYALLYFRPEDLVARLETLLAKEQGSNHDSTFGDASLAPALLDNIRMDLPLKESTDLFRYSLIDQRFDSVVNRVIAVLMTDGKVMLDQWVFVDHPTKSIVMISRTDANMVPAMLDAWDERIR